MSSEMQPSTFEELGAGPSIETSEQEAVLLPEFEGPMPTAFPKEEAEQIKEHLQELEQMEIEAQFAESHFFNLGSEQMEYTVVTPDAGSASGTAPEWAVFIGGFSSIKENYKQEMLDLARAGKHVLFLSPNKGVAPEGADLDYLNVYASALPETIRNKATAVARLLSHLDIHNANIIGHSQGGAVASTLVGMHPTVAKKLILDNPAGLMGGDTVGDLLHRVREESKVEKTWGEQFKKLLKIPLWRAAEEIPSIAHTDVRPILAQLKGAKTNGTGGPEVILVNANNDQIFRKEDIERGLGENPLEQYLDRWAMYADKQKTHGKVDRKDAKLFIQMIDEKSTAPSIVHQLVTEKNPELKKTA